MYFICSECGMLMDGEEAWSCPKCGGRLEPENLPQPAPVPDAGDVNVKWWAITTLLLMVITALVTYILMCFELGQTATVSQTVATPSLEQQAEAYAPSAPASGVAAKPATAARQVYKSYTNCQVGDIFTFGSYPQDVHGKVKPIEWQVLARGRDRMLVIAKYVLDCKEYNDEKVDINWSQCTLRTWLNGEFIEKAFSAEEQRKLVEVTLTNPNGPNNAPGGPETRDKVFLLSMDEAKRYFSGDAYRYCKPTFYAQAHGAKVDYDNKRACRWWLRSPGTSANCATYVCNELAFFHDYDHNDYFHDGNIHDIFVSCNYGVRPAAFLAL